ncbi:MAG: cytochrome c [Bacteroidia bacterium]|nr:cytochrome c [Bacteroidia bacterium]
MVLKKYVFLLLIPLLGMGLINFAPPDWNEDTPVQEVLEYLGESKPGHSLLVGNEDKNMLIQRGEEIVKRGRTIGPDGSKSKFVSKHYVCTSCHNLVQEDPDLKSRDPEARLDYAIEKQLPFLQATTFHGIVNRESWYNDDYYKKYGEFVKPARESLREAIQLCATECAQGRLLEDWEMDAVLAYYWSLEFKLGDLEMNSEQMKSLKNLSENTRTQQDAKELLKSFYMQKSPATFGDAPPDKIAGYGLKGDEERGKSIYTLACLHCHKEGGVSKYTLDHGKLSLRHIRKKIPQDSHMSLYQIVRYGTYALPGHRPYMPHFPLERMSNQQLEDLRAYIEFGAR